MADLSQAKIDLTFKYPFFSSILMRREIRERSDIPTMCVTDDGRIYFNPEFVKGLSHQELVFVLAHEVMHVVCMHGIRRGDRDPKLWNIAGDYYINSFLDTSGVGQRPEGALYKAGCENQTTEEIYSQLLQQQNQQPQQGQGQSQDGDDRDQGGMSTDNSGDPLGGDLKNEGAVTEAEKSEIEARTKLEVAGAVKAAKSRACVRVHWLGWSRRCCQPRPLGMRFFHDTLQDLPARSRVGADRTGGSHRWISICRLWTQTSAWAKWLWASTHPGQSVTVNCSISAGT